VKLLEAGAEEKRADESKGEKKVGSSKPIDHP